MSLGDHLRELRRRLVIAALASSRARSSAGISTTRSTRPSSEPLLDATARPARDELVSAELREADRRVLPAGQHRRIFVGVILSRARSGSTSSGRSSCPG